MCHGGSGFPERPAMWVRCVERLTIVFTAAFIVYLGYRLYAIGVMHGDVEFTLRQLALKGTGPGVLFMVVGAVLLWRSLSTPIRISIQEGDHTRQVELQGDVEAPEGTVDFDGSKL